MMDRGGGVRGARSMMEAVDTAVTKGATGANSHDKRPRSRSTREEPGSGNRWRERACSRQISCLVVS